MCFRLWYWNAFSNASSVLMMAKRFKIENHFLIRKSHSSLDSECESSVNMNNPNNFSNIVPPVKSFSDKKKYSVIQLSNGLTALLISDDSDIMERCNPHELSASIYSDVSDSDSDGSDSENSSNGEMSVGSDTHHSNKGETEKLAACALSIGVGSFSDPGTIPGLAHFLEHMIFMGSEKYPGENEFDIYIKKKGGSDNASTECEHTTFYFDCHEAYLLGAMKIFSELFISPLMKRETMTKEREAIESEFQMSLPSDESRRSQLLCSLADKSNPVNKFMWGNLITLRDNVTDDELYSAVHKFRERHYSAHHMTLAVQARLPTETLENWVVECFKNVPNNNLPSDKFHLSVPPFKQDEFSRLYVIEPIKDINELHITWVLPSTLKMYKTKPLSYISWVIGHEGKGSLHSYLKKQLWTTEISVGDGGDGTEENSLFTLFSMTFNLTQKGITHIEKILHYLFSYLNMFKEIGPQERIFKEIQVIADTSFRYAGDVSSSDNVEQLSENMQFFASTDYITGSQLYFEYDHELICSFLEKLRPDNVNIMISSKVLATSEVLDKVEPWFGTKYTSKDIPSEWRTSWESASDSNHFHLPEVNRFIATNFTILPAPETKEEFPVNVIKDDLIEVWYKQDVTFKLPHAYCCLHLISPLSHMTAQNAAMLELFISILKQHLSEDLYPANVADLEYSFHSGEKGMIITINGFNEKLKDLLCVIINGIRSLCSNLDRDLSLSMKEELKREYANANLKTSFLARDIRMSILLKTYWTALEKGKALEDVSYEMLKDFISNYLQCLYVQCLIQGNLSKEEAIDFTLVVKEGLSYKPLCNNTIPEIQVYRLPPGERYCVVHSFNTEDANSVVTNYYQSGLGTIQDSCVIDLLLMIMEEPLFDSLRTQQQLGYDVSCSMRDTFGILGFSISVHCQTDRNCVELVESKMSDFLKVFSGTLKKTTKEEFEEIKESLIKLKKCKDVHLKEEVKRNWDEIKAEEYIFDRNRREEVCIVKLTLDEVIKWFDDKSGLHNSSSCRKLSTQIVGKVNECKKTNSNYNNISTVDNILNSVELRFLPQNETTDLFIFDIKDFKKSLNLFPPHKIIN